ncbi:hypothetical protein [Pandoraea sputorum]|uniref:hypothetical protein n=1 Tax=Pandoraea sputorum TaxID=93222 RepID=UPI002AF6B8E5|nr:hypothetical protein [Pandoraea sputorum]
MTTLAMSNVPLVNPGLGTTGGEGNPAEVKSSASAGALRCPEEAALKDVLTAPTSREGGADIQSEFGQGSLSNASVKHLAGSLSACAAARQAMVSETLLGGWTDSLSEAIALTEVAAQSDSVPLEQRRRLVGTMYQMQGGGADTAARLSFQKNVDDLCEISAAMFGISERTDAPQSEETWRDRAEQMVERLETLVNAASDTPDPDYVQSLKAALGAQVAVLSRVAPDEVLLTCSEPARVVDMLTTLESSVTRWPDSLVDEAIVVALLRNKSAASVLAMRANMDSDGAFLSHVLSSEVALSCLAAKSLDADRPLSESKKLAALNTISRGQALLSGAFILQDMGVTIVDGEVQVGAKTGISLPAYMLATFQRLDDTGIENLKQFMIALTSTRENWRMLRLSAMHSHKVASTISVANLRREASYAFRKELANAVGMIVGGIAGFVPMGWRAAQAMKGGALQGVKSGLGNTFNKLASSLRSAKARQPEGGAGSVGAAQTAIKSVLGAAKKTKDTATQTESGTSDSNAAQAAQTAVKAIADSSRPKVDTNAIPADRADAGTQATLDAAMDTVGERTTYKVYESDNGSTHVEVTMEIPFDVNQPSAVGSPPPPPPEPVGLNLGPTLAERRSPDFKPDIAKGHWTWDGVSPAPLAAQLQTRMKAMGIPVPMSGVPSGVRSGGEDADKIVDRNGKGRPDSQKAAAPNNTWRSTQFMFDVANAIGRLIQGSIGIYEAFMGREQRESHADFTLQQSLAQQAQMTQERMREQQSNDGDTFTRVLSMVDQMQGNASRTTQQVWAR